MISDFSARISPNVGFTDELLDLQPTLTVVEQDDGYGEFRINGLERGWGTTLGNGLRRVLLGAMPGTAITSASITGIVHEFSTVPHMREGVGEFLINVRGIRIRSISETTQRVLTLHVQGECEVHAGDIQKSPAFEIVNPDHHLATLDSAEAKLVARFQVERGEGYRAFDHEANADSEQSGGADPERLPVDAIFTPVLKANYTVQNLSGRMSGREGLTIKIWTDRTVTPEDALRTSADILTNRLGIFTRDAQESDTPTVSVPLGLESTEIRDLEGVLSTRVINALVRHGIGTIGDLSKYTPEYLKRDVRNFGEKSFNELYDYMIEKGVWSAAE